MFDQFKARMLAVQRVNPDGVFGYQCVDLPIEWAKTFGINGIYGNAIDFWYRPDAKLRSKFTPIASSDARAGDIVVLHTVGHNDDTQPGHVGLATGNINGIQLEILEQNGQTGNGSGVGGDAIRTRWVDRSRVAGLWRPITVIAAQPAPQPAPAPHPNATVHPYRVETIPPKQVQLIRNTHKWGLNYDNLTAIQNNPIESAPVNKVFTASAILYHNIGYQYYLENANNPSGYNVVDCTDYNPAPAPVVHPYTIEVITPKQVKFKNDATKWGMNYDNGAAMEAHPEGAGKKDAIITVRAICHHQIGNYYLEDPSVPSGFNVQNFEDYIPYVPPAAPVPVPKVEKYELQVPVAVYDNADEAKARRKPISILKQGTYILRSSNEKARELVKNNTDKQSYWINDLDNKPPSPAPAPTPPTPTKEVAPAPVEPPKPQYSKVTPVPVGSIETQLAATQVLLRQDRQPDIFYPRFKGTIQVQDIAGHLDPVPLPALSKNKSGEDIPTPIPLVTTFWHNGIEYGRPETCFRATNKDGSPNQYYGSWLGVDMRYVGYDDRSEITTLADRLYNNTAKFGERLSFAVAQAEHFYEQAGHFIEDIKIRRAKK